MPLESKSGMYIPQLIVLVLCCIANGHSETPSFQPETSYRYHYTLDIKVEHAFQSAAPGTSLKLEASVQTYVLWRNKDQPDDQLVHVQIQDVALHHRSIKSNSTGEDISTQYLTQNDSNSLHPILFHWTSGQVAGLFVTKEDSGQILDLKKGLVGLFQFQPVTGIYSEEDVTGKCRVTYNTSGDVIKKTKHLRSCTNSPIGFKADEKVLGVSWNSTSHGHALLKGSTIQMAVSEENHLILLQLKSHHGSRTASRQKLEFISASTGPPEAHGQSVEKILGELPEKYQKVEITSQPVKKNMTIHLLQNSLNALKSKSSKLNVSKASTTRQFHNIVRMLRLAKKSDILLLLQKASSELLPFVVDAAVAAQSPASLDALYEFLDFSKKKQALVVEKFLYSAAFVPNPSTDLLHFVLEKLKGKVSTPALMETGIIVTGAITGKLCKMKLCDLEDVEHAKSVLVEGLKNAEDEAEIKTYLLSLKNAQLSETIPLLLDYAGDKSAVICSTALSALQDFPAEDMSTQEVKDTLKSIFNQTYQAQDRKCRLMAAETLLVTDFSHTDVIEIILGLDSMDNETAKSLISKIQKILTFKHPLMKPVKTQLEGKHLNYVRLSRSGSSNSFSGILTATKDMVSTYGLDLLFTDSGLLKRSVSDIMLFGHNNHLKAVQVSIEAQGLDSIMGDGEAEDSDDEAMVGMSAILFDVQLRPLVFFQGYMDLVSKAFSSSGEPTSVVKGNILLIDYIKWLPMQSGIHLIIECQGGIGLEILANIDVSIWEQHAKTNVNTKAGLVVEFNSAIATPLFKADLKTQVDAETSVNLDSKMAFTGSPMQMCIELSHGDLPYREIYILSESLPGKNTTHTVRKGRKSTVWGRDFPLSGANSEMCRRLKAENDQ
ncbi:microsomal triglyceride transfer protein-like [Pelodytes ibericus]